MVSTQVTIHRRQIIPCLSKVMINQGRWNQR